MLELHQIEVWVLRFFGHGVVCCIREEGFSVYLFIVKAVNVLLC